MLNPASGQLRNLQRDLCVPNQTVRAHQTFQSCTAGAESSQRHQGQKAVMLGVCATGWHLAPSGPSWTSGELGPTWSAVQLKAEQPRNKNPDPRAWIQQRQVFFLFVAATTALFSSSEKRSVPCFRAVSKMGRDSSVKSSARRSASRSSANSAVICCR